MTTRVPLQVRPLSHYPVPETATRKASPFKASIGSTMQLLNKELRLLGATQVIIEADFLEGQIRLDGWPKVDARPRTPRVVLSFVHRTAGALRYPCDTYRTWVDNIRAIALCLEALRAVERHGVVRRAEQYTGWRALPASTTPTLTSSAALLAELSGLPAERILTDAGVFREAARAAQKQAHPDLGGTEAQFQNVQHAIRMLTERHRA